MRGRGRRAGRAQVAAGEGRSWRRREGRDREEGSGAYQAREVGLHRLTQGGNLAMDEPEASVLRVNFSTEEVQALLGREVPQNGDL